MKAKTYTIVIEATIQELVARVNERIGEGWQPIGGAFKVGTDWGIAQTMVK